jgi:hypothetical protein
MKYIMFYVLLKELQRRGLMLTEGVDKSAKKTPPAPMIKITEVNTKLSGCKIYCKYIMFYLRKAVSYRDCEDAVDSV